MNVLQHKLGFKLHSMGILWIMLATFGMFLMGVNAVVGLGILIEHKFPSSNELFWLNIILVAYCSCLFLWRNNVFMRSDFIRLVKREKIELLKGMPKLIVFLAEPIRSMVRGRMGDVYVIAKLNAAWCGSGLGEEGKLTSETLDKTDQVGFAFLVDCPVVCEVNIHLDGENRELPQTGIPEIDEILCIDLHEVNDFRATFVSNREYMCMTIIGGGWFGKRFQDRIIKGFEIARKINEVLKSNYQLGSWDGYQMKWNFESKGFVLVKGNDISLFH